MFKKNYYENSYFVSQNLTQFQIQFNNLNGQVIQKCNTL